MSFLSLPAGAAARPTITGLAVLTDLRDVLPSSLFASGMRAETGSGPFAWDAASLLADDASTVIRPTDVPVLSPGRWIKQASTSPGSGRLEFLISDVYSGVIVPGFFEPPVVVDVGFTLDRVYLQRRTAGASGSTIVDVLKNGTTIFSGLPPRVFASSGNYATANGSAFTLGANVYTPGDVLEVLLSQVELFSGGPPPGPEGLRVTLVKV